MACRNETMTTRSGTLNRQFRETCVATARHVDGFQTQSALFYPIRPKGTPEKGPGVVDEVSMVFQMNGVKHLASGPKGRGQRGKDSSDVIQGYVLEDTRE